MPNSPSAPPGGTPFFTVKQAGRRGPTPQQDRAARTKSQVLTAAAELFAANGFRHTSVKDVAERVEMTKGAVYFHYPNKEALAVAVVEYLYAKWPLLLEEIREEGLTSLDTAAVMLDRAALAFRDDVVVQAGARLQLERPHIEAELPTPYVDWTSLLTELLSAARDEGQIKADIDPAGAARALVAGFFGMQHISDVLQRRADIVDRWQEVRDLLIGAIRA
ncbi:ScbR family autoregulator-binding transcription factor [Streptomyces sp. AC512_CC834]|uniref:ScbR family autoregulator-binding transcription factor n=1 Tax=Streptomyces sp. AC512_CC834 TaxID=2823691 RepID=UPI001C2755DC|nr:ScbR family autoregulator-binding transcription factor [Streptomyces sp. AC512_CC834]